MRNLNVMETTMKKALLILPILAAAALMLGCDDNNNPVYIDKVPAAPQGVYSVTGDHAVEIVWNGVYENDINFYAVYRSLNATTGYNEIGTIDADYNPDLDLIIYSFVDNGAVNGQTYYYAVSAVDDDGQESPLSAETVFDTPRPDGSVDLYSLFKQQNLSGFNLSTVPTRVAWDDVNTDVYVDNDIDGNLYLNVADDSTDIQDVGYTSNFDEIGYSPDNGWSRVGWVELIVGHTYVIWTRDNHFAKMRVIGIDRPAGLVSFTWAYQTDTGNPELAPAFPGAPKPQHDSGYLKQIRVAATEQM